MGSLTGTVLVEGQPLTRGFVTLSDPKAGVSISADIGADGAFHVPALQAGTYRVGFGSHAPSDEEMQAGARVEKLPIAARYESTATSGIEYELKQGRNTVTFRLDGLGAK